LPAALSEGIGSQVQKPLAVVVVTGMMLAPLGDPGDAAGVDLGLLAPAAITVAATAPTACGGRARRRGPGGSAPRADSPAC
jgi:hypothetical protein